jgi:hypothetical protein
VKCKGLAHPTAPPKLRAPGLNLVNIEIKRDPPPLSPEARDYVRAAVSMLRMTTEEIHQLAGVIDA